MLAIVPKKEAAFERVHSKWDPDAFELDSWAANGQSTGSMGDRWAMDGRCMDERRAYDERRTLAMICVTAPIPASQNAFWANLALTSALIVNKLGIQGQKVGLRFKRTCCIWPRLLIVLSMIAWEIDAVLYHLFESES